MPAFVAPPAFKPADILIRDGRLWAAPSDIPLLFPVKGAWRSLAESNPLDEAQLAAIARRFGGLTRDAATHEGEKIWVWQRLVIDLRCLSMAWTETGALADPIDFSEARTLGNKILGEVLNEHLNGGGIFVLKGGEWALRMFEMAQWWRVIAVADVRQREPMRRCRHCGVWFSLAGLRSDAGFCSSAHRSAFYQKRAPASPFWAEVI